MRLVQYFNNMYQTIPKHTCEPFVLEPALAIESSPGLLCFSLKFSSTERTSKLLRYRVFATVKTFSVYRTPACPVMPREIAALQHELIR
jgi:hypothetical protein